MRSLVQLLRAVCIALLLPATVMAAAQTDHVPTLHDCCEGAAPTQHHPVEAAPGSADPARDGPEAPSREPLHVSCGMHACNWIVGAAPIASQPQGLTWAIHAPSAAPTPPAARAESLHRPPAYLS